MPFLPFLGLGLRNGSIGPVSEVRITPDTLLVGSDGFVRRFGVPLFGFDFFETASRVNPRPDSLTEKNRRKREREWLEDRWELFSIR